MQEDTQTTQASKTSNNNDHLLFSTLGDSGHYFMPENFHYFTVNGVRNICQVLAPEIYQEINNFQDSETDQLCDYLSGINDIPSGIAEVLGLILQLRESNLIEQLDVEGIKRLSNESDGALLCRIFKDENEKFKKIAQRLEDTTRLSGISYSVSLLTKPLLRQENFFSSSNVQEMIVQDCSEYYDGVGYTDHCLIKIFKKDNKEGFLIERGSHPRSMAVLDDNKRRINRLNNERKLDSVFFDKSSGTIWVNARGQRSKDVKFLKGLAAKILTGNALAFRDFNFDYQVIKSPKLRETLIVQRDYAQRIILKEASFSQEPTSCISSPLRVAPRSRNECLTDKEDFRALAQVITLFNGINLKIVLNEESKSYGKLHIRSGRIHLDDTLKIEDIIDLLLDLKLVRGIENA